MPLQRNISNRQKQTSIKIQNTHTFRYTPRDDKEEKSERNKINTRTLFFSVGIRRGIIFDVYFDSWFECNNNRPHNFLFDCQFHLFDLHDNYDGVWRGGSYQYSIRSCFILALFKSVKLYFFRVYAQNVMGIIKIHLNFLFLFIPHHRHMYHIYILNLYKLLLFPMNCRDQKCDILNKKKSNCLFSHFLFFSQYSPKS